MTDDGLTAKYIQRTSHFRILQRTDEAVPSNVDLDVLQTTAVDSRQAMRTDSSAFYGKRTDSETLS